MNNYENSMSKMLLHSEKCNNIIENTLVTDYCDISMPICIELHLTNKCNLSCEWCIDRKLRSDNKEIPLALLMNLLNDIEGKKVGLTIEGGGEPTMHMDSLNFSENVIEEKFQLVLLLNEID